MYREPYDALVETIDRLQRELGDVAGFRRRFPERLLWFVTATSVLGAVLAIAALTASRAHARQLEETLSTTRARLDAKTQALGQCESFAQDSVNAQRQYATAIDRYKTWSCWEP
jgi:hypothetical protein